MKSELHYHNFITAVKSKYKRMASEKAEGDEENSKRIKMETEEGVEVKDEEANETGNEGDGTFISLIHFSIYLFIFYYIAAYDPEEACKEEENEDAKVEEKDEEKQENTEENWLDQAFPIENTENDQKIESKEDVEPVQPDIETKSPRRRGAVRNGAGPKSKTRGKK